MPKRRKSPRPRSRQEDPPAVRAVAYLRVSTEKQAAEGVSLAAQRDRIERYAHYRASEEGAFELVAVLEDAGLSGKTLERPALDRALSMLSAGEADALVVVKLDRLTRSVAGLAALLDRSSREGWALVSLSEHLDTKSAAGRLMANILASISQWEREAIGERTAAAMQHKAAQGEYTGGHVPYGFRLSLDGVHLEEHPGEQMVMAAARDLRGAGMSLRAIGAELAERGLMTRNGRRWGPKQVRRLVAGVQ